MSSSPRLAMTLVVRDEADIIADNIRFHHRLGVDCFVVTDNGSVDGTRAILASLQGDVEMTVFDEPEPSHDHDIWTTRMADFARTELGADWIILNDADEFWLPRWHTLKEQITSDVAILECPRVNMLELTRCTGDENYPFFKNVVKIDPPFTPITAEEVNRIPRIDRWLPGKVMCALEGLQRVELGNHDVVHEDDRRRMVDSILIYHYPLRGYEQFERKVRNHIEGLTRNSRFSSSTSWHLRRWHEALVAGQLPEVYEGQLLAETELDSLIAQGVAAIDYSIWAQVSPATLPGVREIAELRECDSQGEAAILGDLNPPLQIHSQATNDEIELLRSVVSGEEYPFFLKAPAPNLIIDIGANIGAFAYAARHRYPDCPIICFEPSPRNLPLLRANLDRLGNAELLPHGLHVTPRLAALHIGIDGSGLTDSIHLNRLSGATTIPVSLAGSLQSLAPRLVPGTLLKCDTEGSEVAILGSLGSFLDQVDTVYVEYHSEGDRRRIDEILAMRFVLGACRASVPHRGTCSYFRRDLVVGSELEIRSIDTSPPIEGGSVTPASPSSLGYHEMGSVIEAFSRLWYESFVWAGATKWLDVPVLKHPCDLWVYQELLTRLRPDFIVEAGTNAGGCALFLATICDELDFGTILTIDTNPHPDRPEHQRIQYFTGRSTDPEIVQEIHERTVAARNVLVLLDSDHRAANVRAELEAYHDLVPVGGYLVVEDTNVNGNPVLPDFGPGPREAVDDFLAKHPNFERDGSLEKFLITANPGGFLKRVF